MYTLGLLTILSHNFMHWNIQYVTRQMLRYCMGKPELDYMRLLMITVCLLVRCEAMQSGHTTSMI